VKRIDQLMRRMPELLLIEPRLADPEWHPTEQEIAEAWAVVSRAPAPRQSSLPLQDVA